MRELFKIVGYIIVVMLGGALLAPPLWWLGQWAIDIDLVPQLRPFAFDKYFNRAALLLAVGLLPVLVRSLHIGNWQALGIEHNPYRGRDIALGLTVAVGGFALSVAALTACGALELDLHGGTQRAWLLALVAAAVVSCMEEILFRGVFFGVMRRTLRPYTALAALSVLFASLHFLRPNPSMPKLSDVTYLSGLQLLPYLLWEYVEPARLWGSWTTLTVMAWVLGDTVLKTRSLYLAGGLHAGWVFSVKALSLIALPQSRQEFWLGSDWRSGAAPLTLMLSTSVVMRLVLRHRAPSSAHRPPQAEPFLPEAQLS